MLLTYVLLLASTILLVAYRGKRLWFNIGLRLTAYLLPLATIFAGEVDQLSTTFAILAIPVAIASSMYSLWYSKYKYGSTRLQVLLDLFNVSIIYTLLAPNLIGFIALWTFSEIVGFLLVSYEGGEEAFRAGYRFFFLKALTFETSALALVAFLSTKASIGKVLLAGFNELPSTIVDPYYAILLMIGYTATAALIPLHFWLPDAHSTAPSPASAVLSGVTVKEGFYALMRLYNIVLLGEWSKYLLLGMGFVTCIYGFLMLISQRDVKRMLAYSTIGNTGLIAVLQSLYLLNPTNTYIYLAFITSIYAHGLYKAALFINAGTVEAVAHTRIMDKVHGLVAYTPISSLANLFTVLSVIGIPPTIGFMSKLLSVIGVLEIGLNTITVAILCLIGYSILVSLSYGVRILRMHWEAGKIEDKAKKLEGYPQTIELGLASMSLIYGFIIPLISYTETSFTLILVNVFSLLVIVLLVYTFYYNIRLRIVEGITGYVESNWS